MSDLIVKGAGEIKDGLYNIKDGKLFQYKANGGTVRTYQIVSADRPKWIPVSERLPEEGDVVLICSKSGVIDFGKRKGDKWVWLAEALWDYWQETEDLIAWMPLPEAYKESDIDGSD